MNFINILDSIYLEEYLTICYNEWSDKSKPFNLNDKIKRVKGSNNIILAIGLIENNILVGFISLFKNDCTQKVELTPWYATMYVKNTYRNKGYSKLLNNELIKQAHSLGYEKIYLKSKLSNYYEKFGANYLSKLEDGEKLYYINTKKQRK